MLRNLLLYRFAIFNLLMLSLLGYAADRGVIGFLLDGDRSGIVAVIVTLFAVVWAATARKVLRISRGLNDLKDGDPNAGTPRERRKDMEKAKWLTEASGWLVGLGLIGTVVGFAVALGGVDQNSLADASGVQSAVGELMAGMKIALNTTIAGAVLGMWNEVNQRMLRTAMECYWSDREA